MEHLVREKQSSLGVGDSARLPHPKNVLLPGLQGRKEQRSWDQAVWVRIPMALLTSCVIWDINGTTLCLNFFFFISSAPQMGLMVDHGGTKWETVKLVKRFLH